MKRSLYALLLAALLGPGCRSAGPKGPGPAGEAPPDLLRSYVGELRVLRHKGDERAVTVKPQERLSGECDTAVRVRSASFERGSARFALETVGLPRVGGREARCQKLQPGVQLSVTGFPAAPDAAAVTARVDEVLQTPEAFLTAKGTAFDRPAGKAPADVASREADASGAERSLATKVTAWPKLLLEVSPYYHDLSGRVRHEGEVAFDAVVGEDGRLHRPRIKTGLGETHEATVLAALAFWRYEPARAGDAATGARVGGRTVLRVYH